MPYIKDNQRVFFERSLNSLAEEITEPGELCYCVYKLLQDLTFRDGQNFSKMSSLISEIECAKLEYYRRIVAPYEDNKIKENGDVK